MSASANNWAGEGMFAERIPEKHEPSPTPEPDSRQGEETAAFVLVPREPTEAMVDAACNIYSTEGTREQVRHDYRAMLAASPAVPATQGAGGGMNSPIPDPKE